MASKIKVKRSSVFGKAPTTSDIEVGEIAINTRDSKMFSRDTSLGVFEIGANVSSSTIGTLKVGNTNPYTLPTADGSNGQVLKTNDQALYPLALMLVLLMILLWQCQSL